MEKYFVTYNQALLLNELGFDKPCIAFFNGKHHDYKIDDENGSVVAFINTNMDIGKCLNRPLKTQVFEWVREKHRLCGVPQYFTGGFYCYTINDMKDQKESNRLFTEFETIDEAESACIDKLIEIIKTK